MSALMYKQSDQTHGGKLTCLICLHHFGSKRTLNEHIEKCLALHDGKCLVKMPKEGSVVKFKNFMKMEKVPYVVYGDFDTVLDKNTDVHIACGFAVQLVKSMGKSLRFYQYRGEDTMDRFFEELDVIERMVDEIHVAEIIITPEQRVV